MQRKSFTQRQSGRVQRGSRVRVGWHAELVASGQRAAFSSGSEEDDRGVCGNGGRIY